MGVCCGKSSKKKPIANLPVRGSKACENYQEQVDADTKNLPCTSVQNSIMNAKEVNANILINVNNIEEFGKTDFHPESQNEKSEDIETNGVPSFIHQGKTENQLEYERIQSQPTEFLAINKCYFFGIEGDKPQIVKFEPHNQGFSTISPPANMELFTFSSATCVNESRIYVAGGFKDEVIVSNRLYVYDAINNIAELLPSFHVKRFAHQATLFKDHLYLLGGIGQNHQNLTSCEKFNTKTKEWDILPNLNIPRSFGIVFIYNEEIYLMGGTTENLQDINSRKGEQMQQEECSKINKNQYSRKIEKLDNSNKKWIILDMKLPIGIDNTFAYSVCEDELQLFGGQTYLSYLNANIAFNLENGTYILKRFMKNQRVAHKGYSDGSNIWIFGGDNNDSIELYDTLRDEWNQSSLSYKGILNQIQTYACSSTPLLIKKSKSQSFLSSSTNSKQSIIESDRCCFLFGDDFVSFILQINFGSKHIKEYSIPYNLKLLGYQGVCKLPDGRYFFNGGMDSTNSYISNNTYIYSPKTNKAIKTSKSSFHRYTFNIVAKEIYVYAIGGRTWGEDEVAIMSDCERYDLSRNTWENIASLNQKRCSGMTFIHENKIYIAGGYGGDKVRCTTIERYNESQDYWETINVQLCVSLDLKSDIGFIHSGLEGSCVLSSEIPNIFYFVGGRTDISDVDNVWEFDLETGETKDAGILQDKKSLHKIARVNDDKICIFGGESKFIEFFNIKEGKSIQDDFSIEIEDMLTKIFLTVGREHNIKLIRKSLVE